METLVEKLNKSSIEEVGKLIDIDTLVGKLKSFDKFFENDLHLGDLLGYGSQNSEEVPLQSTSKQKLEQILNDFKLSQKEKDVVRIVVHKAAFPWVQANGTIQPLQHNPTIRDIQEVVKAGLLHKIEGFDNKNNVRIVGALFSSRE